MAEEEKQEDAAPAAEEAEAVVKKEAAAAPGLNPKLVLLVLVLNAVVLLILAGVVWKSYMSSKSEVTLADVAASPDGHKKDDGHGAAKDDGHGGGAKEKAPADNFIQESFTVNLADSRGAHFAKVDVAIEIEDDFVREEVTRLKPKIRDFINVVLSSKTYEQVDSSTGREFLKEEIRNKINGYLTRGQVKDVFFTQFIIQ